MRSALLYRIASVLIFLFAVGHTVGFRKPAEEGEGRSVGSLMQTVHLKVQGFDRTFWDFYVGFGLFVTVFLLLAAVLSWQLGGVSAEGLRSIPGAATWGLAICFVLVTILSWRYFFAAPGIFSTVIAVCLLAAAALVGRP